MWGCVFDLPLAFGEREQVPYNAKAALAEGERLNKIGDLLRCSGSTGSEFLDDQFVKASAGVLGGDV